MGLLSSESHILRGALRDIGRGIPTTRRSLPNA